MANHLETVTLEGRRYIHDHSTGRTTCHGIRYDGQGYSENWDAVKRGYSKRQAFIGFLILTDQWDRYNLENGG